MLSVIEARKKGIRSCMNKIGFDFCMANEENSVTAYSEYEGNMYCFVGINDNPVKDRNPDILILSNNKGFPYYSSCNVNMNNGDVEFLDFVAYHN